MLLQRDSDATHQEPFELHDFRYSRECKCPFVHPRDRPQGRCHWAGPRQGSVKWDARVQIRH